MNIFAIVESEVELWAVFDSKSLYCQVWAHEESDCLIHLKIQQALSIYIISTQERNNDTYNFKR